ncbi:TPA: hypothetical protein ACXRUV_005084 [Klebsiella quasipneumoniae subsp. similipneumoniae]
MLPSGRYMDILIIADDSYFSLGLEHYIQEKRRTNSQTTSVAAESFIKDESWYQCNQKRIVIVSIKDLKLFAKVIEKIRNNYWEMVFFFDVKKCTPTSCKWRFTSKRNHIDDFLVILEHLDSVNRKESLRNSIHFREESIVNQLCKGTRISKIAEKMGVDEKYIYREKGRVVKKLGLEHLNSMNLLLCQSLLNIGKFKNMESM